MKNTELTNATHELEAVWQILKHHAGRANAIKKRQLVALTGYNERAIRQAISDLITKHEKPIAQSSDRDGGYFLITNEHERQRAIADLRSRMRHLAARYRALDQTGFRETICSLFDEPASGGMTSNLFGDTSASTICQACFRLQEVEADPRARCIVHRAA